MPDFNNGPGNELNSGSSLALRRLFETDVNNHPPQAIPNPVSDGEYICSGVLLMVFWCVPYLSKGVSDVNRELKQTDEAAERRWSTGKSPFN